MRTSREELLRVPPAPPGIETAAALHVRPVDVPVFSQFVDVRHVALQITPRVGGGHQRVPQNTRPLRARDVDGLRSLRALHHIELDFLSILQRPAHQRQVGREMFDCIHDSSIKIPGYAVRDIEL